MWPMWCGTSSPPTLTPQTGDWQPQIFHRSRPETPAPQSRGFRYAVVAFRISSSWPIGFGCAAHAGGDHSLYELQHLCFDPPDVPEAGA